MSEETTNLEKFKEFLFSAGFTQISDENYRKNTFFQWHYDDIITIYVASSRFVDGRDLTVCSFVFYEDGQFFNVGGLRRS